MYHFIRRLLPRRPRSPLSKKSIRPTFRPWLEQLEDRVVPSSADGNGPVITGMTSAPGSNTLTISFDGPLSLPAGTLLPQSLAFFQVNQLTANPELISSPGPALPILSGTYSSTSSFSSQVTLTLSTPLTQNTFYRVFVNGTPVVENGAAVPGTAIFGGSGNNSNGVPLDGDNDDTPTGNFYGLFATGTNLSFTDAKGTSVSVSVSGGTNGAVNVWRELNGNIDQLQVLGTGATLNGSVSPTTPVTIGSTTIPVASAFVLGGAINKLPASFLTPTPFTGSTTTGSNVIPVSSTAGLQVGQLVVGASVPVGGVPSTGFITQIAAIGTNRITLNQNSLGTTTSPISLAAFPDTIQAVFTGTTVKGTGLITNVSFLSGGWGNLAPGQSLTDSTGANLPGGATILSVDQNTQTITMSAPFVAAGQSGKFTITASSPAFPPITQSPTPIVATSSNLPYTLSVTPVANVSSILPSIQTADYFQVAPFTGYPQGLWVIIGGRTNGLHNFSTSGQSNFPPDSQNLNIILINPTNMQVVENVPWSATDVPLGIYNPLSSVAQQSYQDSTGTAYITGGYSSPISAVFTGSVRQGSNVITNVSSTAGLAIGQSIALSDTFATTNPIPQSALIVGINGNTVTLNVAATATQTNLSLSAFSDTIVNTFTGNTAVNSSTITNVSSTAGLVGGNTLTDSQNALPVGSIVNNVGTNQVTFTQLTGTQGATSKQTNDTITASYANFTTYNTLTSFSVTGLVNALLNPVLNAQGQIQVAAGANFQQITNSAFQVTGGKMAELNGVTYLVIGQDFEGGYLGPSFVQTYTDEIRSFTISNTPLSITNLQVLHDPENLRRRDYNLGTVLQPNNGDQPGLSIFGGVFTEPGQIGFGNPVVISGNGSPPTAQVNFGYSQYFGSYDAANIPLFDSTSNSMYTVFLGGIGAYDYPYPNGPLQGPNTGLPWIDDVTTFATDASGADQEYVMPPIPSVGAGTGNYGAGAFFFPSPTTQAAMSNGVINLNSLPSGPFVLGYMYGGIYSPYNNGGNPLQTVASDQVFAIILNPDQISVVSGANQSSTVTTAFANAIEFKVTDGSGSPITNLTLGNFQFSGQDPTTGASATFSGFSNLGGGLYQFTATANQFADAPQGSLPPPAYNIQVQLTGGSNLATVPLTNTLAPFTPDYTDLDGYVTQIATTTNANGTLTVFGIGGDNAVWYRQENVGNDPTSFGPWTSLGGYAKGLAVAAEANGTPTVFVIGGDNQVWVNSTLTPNAWTSIGSGGGSAIQLAAALDGNGNLEVFAISGGHAAYVDIGPTFGSWTSLGGYVTQIAVGQNGSDQTLQLFGIGGDNAAWTDKQTNLTTPTVFTGWNSLGGYVTDLTVGQNQAGTLQLFAVGGDHAAWTDQQTTGGTYTSAGFSGWNSLGGFINDLTVARNSDGTLSFFGIGGDNAVWSRTQSTPGAFTSATFGPYQSFGGFVKQVVAGVNPTNETLQFFGIGGDNAVYTKAQDILLAPQLLAGTPQSDSSADALTATELAPIITAAEANWEALGVSASRFQGLQFQIATLSSGWLGAYQAGTIYLDPTADGYGWFIDPVDGDFTPANAQEMALPSSAAARHIDLLTVVMHELGHALGLPDVGAGTDLMATSLAAGVRRDPTMADIDAAFGG